MNIFEMAQKAGFNDGGDCIDIKAFEALVRADEREAAAKEAEAQGCHMVAAAIRARGTT